MRRRKMNIKVVSWCMPGGIHENSGPHFHDIHCPCRDSDIVTSEYKQEALRPLESLMLRWEYNIKNIKVVP
jgi:hypothetical protein